jgi:hypothetical protein
VHYEKNHAYYRFKTTESVAELICRQLEWFDGLQEQPVRQPN